MALVLLNGLFAASEMALISSNRMLVKKTAESGDKRYIMLLEAIEQPSRFLATIQIGISIINLFSGAFAADAFADPIVAVIISLGVDTSSTVLRPIVFLVITLILSYFILIFGELVPKRIGIHFSAKFAPGIIGFLMGLSKVVSPFVKLLSVSTDLILKLMGIDATNTESDVTEEEIRMLVESGGEHGSIAESEQEMINNIFEFDNKTAEDACVHRVDVVAISIDASVDEIIKTLAEEKYSRIPIFGENIDDILGILYIKDIINYLVEHKDLSNLVVKELLHEPYFVPFSKKADELFHEMQAKRVHMAVVIDEYGGTMGVITMEDLVEEIMGNIFDEHDEVELPDIVEIDECTFKINGNTDLDIVCEHFNVSLPMDDYDTLSGFLVGQLGHIPVDGEKPELEFNGLLFKVESVFERRIADVIVCKV